MTKGSQTRRAVFAWGLAAHLALGIAFSAPRVWAQDEDDSESIPVDDTVVGDDANADEAAVDEGAPVKAPSGQKAGADGKDPPQVSETHVVQGGDTLWDLCSHYLNSPWYWPKIWSYNPQITNPHWIYPGNELRFYPSDENLPTQVAVSRQIETTDSLDEVIPDQVDPNELVKTTGNIQVGRTQPNSYFASYVGFMSANDRDQAGEIVNSESEAYLLSDYDRVYVKLKTAPKKGDNFALYRTLKPIEHPVTGDIVGYAVEIIGGMTVVDTSPSVATGQIAQTYRPIERGDFVGKWPENAGQRVNPTPNQTEVQGYIIETLGDTLTELGEHNVVFIDKGRSHGVQQGNTFAVLSRGDGYTRDVAGLPNEDVGQLLVVDVQDKSSTAVVTASVHEFAVGDKIQMRKN